MLDFQNHLGKQVVEFLEGCLLDEDRIRVVTRPLYHSKYKFSIGLQLNLSQWFQFDSVKKKLQAKLQALPDYGLFTAHSRTFGFYLYSSNPSVFNVLREFDHSISFGFVNIIDKAYWDKPLPLPKPKHKFYHSYNFRIRFSRPTIAFGLEDEKILSKLKGNWGWSHNNNSYLFYVAEARDMMLLKLLFSEFIVDIEDRSECPC